MKHTIKSWLRKIIWEGEAETTKEAVTKARNSGADLSGAVLRGAVLSDADLSGADLSDAVLSGADLSGAVLSGADLSGADLSDAVLRDAVLSGADLRGADLSDADLSDAVLRGAAIPKIKNIDSVILQAVTAEGCSLEMGNWHTCKTTHCRGGWAIHLAGEAGRKLEKAVGENAAAALIYAASRKSGIVPNFFATNEAAMADMQKCAALEKEGIAT